MRHKNSGRYLNRTGSHRRAMFYNMSRDLIKYESIKTTLPKAKELRMYLEPLMSIAKVDNVTNRRAVFSRIRDKKIVNKLFTNLAIRYLNRPGGYLRIIKYKHRVGDSAVLAIIELVDKKQSNI
ncbi:MAG TPA: 50S ribosomal protein L17 [Candidatus Azoamicus sp. OHIO1]